MAAIHTEFSEIALNVFFPYLIEHQGEKIEPGYVAHVAVRNKTPDIGFKIDQSASFYVTIVISPVSLRRVGPVWPVFGSRSMAVLRAWWQIVQNQHPEC